MTNRIKYVKLIIGINDINDLTHYVTAFDGCGTEIIMEKVKIGVVGLGGRGNYHAGLIASFDNAEVTAVCDLYQDRIESAQKAVQQAGGNCPTGYADYRQMFEKEKLDGVLIATSWTTHTRIAIAAMKAGIRPASEVYGAASIEECWSVVRTAEETGIQPMFLENCNFGREELALLNMVKMGLFGEIVHCQCGYEHCLRDEITMGNENRHYRFNNYAHRNGDVYPTHGLGPMSKILNINRGNRFVSITSTASKQCGLNAYAKAHFGADHPANNVKFQMGDVVTSVIKCAGGETILLTHDTSNFRPYSRAGRVQGTNGIWLEDKAAICLESDNGTEGEVWKPFCEYMDKYDHPIWKKFNGIGLEKYGHGGMDYIVDSAFIDCVVNNAYPAIDVYDWACWMAVTVLSEQSVSLGGMPQLFPDFTNGSWLDGTLPKCTSDFCLD